MLRSFYKEFLSMAGSSRFVARACMTALACTFLVFAPLGAQQPPSQQQQAQPPAMQPPAQGSGRQGQGREGQPGGAGRGEQPAPAAQQKPVVPVATNTVNAHPDTYVGQTVTMTASVDQILSKSAFAVDQHRVEGAPAPKNPTDVLVLVPTLQSPVDPNSYVTVMGELVKFDPAEIAKKAKDYKLDLPPDAIAKYAGRPALIATSVITEKFVDLAKRLPPPMTADEEALSKIMKQLPPALAALRSAVDANKAEDATKNAMVLRQGFTDTEAFWKPKKAEPTQFAHDAKAKVEGIQASIAAGKWEDAKTAAGALQGACGQCHNTYRERFDDGSFRIKK
jgi:cytochrome c556